MMLPASSVLLRAVAAVCVALLTVGDPALYAGPAASPQTEAQGTDQAAPLAAAELDSVVAPIALYPDELLAQILAAATYPLEIVDANQWLNRNSSLKGEALVQAAAKQDWEPSVQALVMFPSVLQQLDQNLKWTTALGNAFLAQQEGVMSAVQRLRMKAQAAGSLQSNAQQKVEVQQVDGTEAIVIQPSDPQVIYVPAYNPEVVFGAAPVYAPYPVMVYPSSMISFGTGVAIGAILGGWNGGWGWGCTWGPRPSLYVNNVFINRYGFRAAPYASHYGTAAWSHNPYYRRATPYPNAAVATRYGAGYAAATPYRAGAAVRGPAGAAGAVAGPRGAAAAVSTPRGSAGAVATPYGSAARVATPSGSAARVTTPRVVRRAWQLPTAQ